MPEPLDINRAGADELAELPGIGEVLAARIVSHRERIHGFTEVADLIHVPGISERVVIALEPHVVLSETPAPTAHDRFEVRLDPEGAPGTFVGHSVVIEGRRSDEKLGDVPFATATQTTEEGVAELEIPGRPTLLGDVSIRVLAPDGSELAGTTRSGTTLPDTITLKVAPQAYGTTQVNDAPGAGKPTRLRGRVIDAAGKRQVAAAQVILWGSSVEEPDEADFRALLVATTDSLGHFTGPYPLGTFTGAHATVGLGDPPATVPVHLDDESFPESVILVVDVPEDEAAEDCNCPGESLAPRSPDATDLARADGTFSADAGAGRCVDFTKPDRTLEEFSYSYLVRTTEPEIRGLTLDEPRRIPISRIFELVSTDLRPERIQMLRAASFGEAGDEGASIGTRQAAQLSEFPREGEIDAGVLRTLARDPEAFSSEALVDAAHLTRHGDLLRLLDAAIAPPPGRHRLTCATPVDWDDDPTVYQACTISHGHVLRFKQEWVADGYSMGSLLYSLPLAPGQKKQIAVVDWERRETAARTEAIEARESLDAILERDRDVNEIVTGVLSESVRGGSHASSGSIAAGIGVGAILGPVGALVGVGGGHSSADSSAWQNSSRNTAATALNQLRDRTIQSASSVRSQRSSVVQTVSEGERVVATTESVANYNHCHAITVQYFEVLRHLLVRQRMVDVQECLFVPLLMSWFTAAKALRWRHTLVDAVPRRLRSSFDALDRISANYAGSDLPLGRYADETLETVEGDLRLRFQLARPRDKDDQFDASAWSPLLGLFGFSPQDFYDQFLKEQQFKDRVFLEQLGPRIASTVVQLLRVRAFKEDGTQVDLKIDPTLVTQFRNDQALYVTLRMSAPLPPVKRSEIKAVVISSRLELPGLPFVIDLLPTGSRIVVDSGSLRYRTAHRADALFSDAFIRNDLTGYDDVRIETPLNRQELRNPREEDKELVRRLLDHLNENIERYHHALWALMSSDRRYMLLDGFEAPNSGGRSVASVVDNDLIGIVGNCLVMPVARGFHLDPTYSQDEDEPVDLVEHYAPNTPIEPSRVALPTSGVYAEAVMGACNSCESIDETRFWRWEESPIPDSPSTILPTSTASRRSEPPDLTAKDFPTPIIAMQNAPAAPDPAGVGAALSLLGQSGLFRDVAGLEGTQRNAAAALEQAFSTATAFGTKAADLALQAKMTKDIDKTMKTIQAAKSQGLIDEKQAGQLTETAIRAMVGAGTTSPSSGATTEDVERLTQTAGEHDASVKVTRPTGERVEVDARETAAEDRASRPIILLSRDASDPQARAFRPAADDKTGIIDAEASFRDAPAGSTLRWSSPDAAGLKIDSPAVGRTRVRGLKPGRRDLDVELLDSGGTVIASQKLKLSVPQYVRVIEDAAAFDAALAASHLTGQKADVIAHAKETVAQALKSANVRVYWQVGGLNEALPAHVTAANHMTVTIRDTDPGGTVGTTHPPGALNRFDEKIDIFPGGYDDPDAIDVDTETQALIIQLDASTGGNPALEAVAAKVYGRLIGETTGHEIVHGMLWDQINPPSDHNAPAVAGDLMNAGVDRLFGQRTGMENTAQVSPVLPEHFVDHGLATIGSLKATNQAIMDQHFPVPPAAL